MPLAAVATADPCAHECMPHIMNCKGIAEGEGVRGFHHGSKRWRRRLLYGSSSGACVGLWVARDVLAFLCVAGAGWLTGRLTCGV